MKTNAYLDEHAERLIAHSISLSQVLLFGLEEKLAADLVRVLAPNSQVLSAGGAVPSGCAPLLENDRLDIIFCSSKPEYCKPLLAAVRQSARHIPVVVVSAEPEFAQWLDAMEAGASDYCAAPFEQSQIHFILSAHLTASQMAA